MRKMSSTKTPDDYSKIHAMKSMNTYNKSSDSLLNAANATEEYKRRYVTKNKSKIKPITIVEEDSNE